MKKKFEYCSFICALGDTLDDTLDELGRDGWEAFAMFPYGAEIVTYLKREKTK